MRGSNGLSNLRRRWAGFLGCSASACYGFDTGPFGPEPYMIAAASPGLFNNGAACGTFYQVTCLGATSGAAGGCSSTPTVTVKVVDKCPGCFEPGLDLYRDAFNVISNTAVGRINVNIQQYESTHHFCSQITCFGQ